MSDRKAIVELPSGKTINRRRKLTRFAFRRRSPQQHSTMSRDLANVDLSYTTAIYNPQAAWNLYYSDVRIEVIYPIPATSLYSNHPPNITPEIKALLRRKNRLMRCGGKIDKASVCEWACPSAIERSNEL